VTRPKITAHYAQSLDGRIAFPGRETEFSTPEGRRCAHAERAAHDAVLVGASTVRIDDPQLTVRETTGSDPLRIVLASALDVPLDARVVRSGTLVIGANERAREENAAVLRARGVEVVLVDGDQAGLVSIAAALDELHRRGVRRLLVEGGARVLTSFFRARAVDRVNVEIASVFVGADGVGALGALAIEGLAAAPTLANVQVERLGRNVMMRGDVVHA
jgi:riboflavin-specific deaminase-like protein